MPSSSRKWICGESYHVSQRGNHRCKVFHSHLQMLAYLKRVDLLCRRYHVRLESFTLMDNHVHFLMIPLRKNSISFLMRDLQSGHARAVHAHFGTDGHLWKHKFWSRHVPAEQYRTVMWYIEYNPVRAGLKRRPVDYEWSTARAHAESGIYIGQAKGKSITIALYLDRWRALVDVVDYAKWLTEPGGDVDPELIAKLDAMTQCGAAQNRVRVKRSFGLHARRLPKIAVKPKVAAAART